MNKRFTLFLLFLSLATLSSSASKKIWGPNYFPIGTKWTELRLDRSKYDSWYTKSGEEWVPNFEQIGYYVKDVYTHENLFSYYTDMYTVFCQREARPDSLCYLICEFHYIPDSADDGIREYYRVKLSVPDDSHGMLIPANSYSFGDWETGKRIGVIYRLISSIADGLNLYNTLGTAQELGEGYFGGEHKQTYAITDKGYKLIDGIGITSWDGPDCIFGPSETQEVAAHFQEVWYEPSPYTTILAHFERNGEVLYDMWPQPGNENSIKGLKGTSSPSLQKEGIYDLQGRRLMKAPEKGLYIQDGQIKMIE
jgi:hypothetical protein